MESIYNFTYCGLEVSSIADMKQLEEYFLNIWDIPKSKSSVFGYSMSIYPRLKENPDLYTYSSEYDLIVSDGVKFHKLGQRFGFPFKYMISIPQTVLFVLDLARKYNKTVMLVGATEDVLRAAEKKLKESKITILPGLNGYFTKDDEENVLNHINNYNPDILLLGMPTPKKEKFNYDYKTKIDAKVILLCGGMIDVIAEKSTLPPQYIKKMGLSGLYRIIQEPRRMYKRFLNYYFIITLYYIPKLWIEFVLKKNKSFSIVKSKSL
jgi:N-acetylglucosaminyldiphosphoundecaprenol N-acetyl-beta-D-mannosaminyltransferase